MTSRDPIRAEKQILWWSDDGQLSVPSNSSDEMISNSWEDWEPAAGGQRTPVKLQMAKSRYYTYSGLFSTTHHSKKQTHINQVQRNGLMTVPPFNSSLQVIHQARLDGHREIHSPGWSARWGSGAPTTSPQDCIVPFQPGTRDPDRCDGHSEDSEQWIQAAFQWPRGRRLPGKRNQITDRKVGWI